MLAMRRSLAGPRDIDMTAGETSAHPIAILPLGATEQHGPHLPPDTDWIIAEAVAGRLEQRLGASMPLMVLPVEKLGYSVEHLDLGQTTSLTYGEAVERWIAIGRGCKERGIDKFVMLNAHGGNSPLMTIVATELRIRFGLLAVATSWTRFGWPEGLVSEEERAYGIHGGFIETSVMLALRPDLVDMAKAADFASAQMELARDYRYLRAYGPHAFGWKMSDLSPAGVTGNAASASAKAGERLLDHAVQGLCALMEDVHRFPLDSLR